MKRMASRIFWRKRSLKSRSVQKRKLSPGERLAACQVTLQGRLGAETVVGWGPHSKWAAELHTSLAFWLNAIIMSGPWRRKDLRRPDCCLFPIQPQWMNLLCLLFSLNLVLLIGLLKKGGWTWFEGAQAMIPKLSNLITSPVWDLILNVPQANLVKYILCPSEFSLLSQ